MHRLRAQRCGPVWLVSLGVALVVLGGCAKPGGVTGQRWAPPSAQAPATQAAPSPTPPGPSIAPTTPASPRPSRSPTTQVRTVQWYISQLPKFGAPPKAVRVTLPHAEGSAAWAKRIPTTQPVAFITIDDGWTRRPEAIQLLRAARVPVSLFLTVNAIQSNPGYFRSLQQLGAVIEAHTITHRKLVGMTYEEQRNEICGSADWLGAQYGRRPTLFRPPFGEKDDVTLKAAHDCGIKACFFWTQTVDKGEVRYQTAEKRIQRGDIILMHFREAYADDFLATLRAIKAAGLTPALLENYVS